MIFTFIFSLMMTSLAQTVGDIILEKGNPAFHLKEVMTNRFVESDMLPHHLGNRMGGVIVAFYDEFSVDFNVVYTTDSMCWGFMVTNEKKPKVCMSRNTAQNSSSTSSNRLTMEGFIVKL